MRRLPPASCAVCPTRGRPPRWYGAPVTSTGDGPRSGRFVRTYVRPYRGLVVVCLLALPSDVAFELFLRLSFKALIDDALTPRDHRVEWRLALVFVVGLPFTTIGPA